MLKKVLVANRGEVAVRILRACRELGLATVTVYSDVDRSALHVRQADESYLLGPASPRESYLSISRLIEIARRSGADAIHPGYGFLAENAAFARACHEAGLTFVGPQPEVIELMGNKVAARQVVQAAGIPVSPGTGPGLSDAELTAAAQEIGYPIMVKATAGGGGKGMRLVRSGAELQAAAILRMQRALDEYRIVGIRTTIPFHQELMNNARFIAGQFDTTFVEEGFVLVEEKLEAHLKVVAIAATLLAHHRRPSKPQRRVVSSNRRRTSNWKTSGQWRV